MTARTVMIRWTASSVGQSLLLTGICRPQRAEVARRAPWSAP